MSTPEPMHPPLTVAEALRRIAAEELERRRQEQEKAAPDRAAQPEQETDTST